MKRIFFFLLAFVFFTCQRDRTAEVALAMKKYDRNILMMNGDSLANCFLPDGILGGEGQSDIVGQDSIRSFLYSLKGAKVLENQSVSDEIDMMGDSAHQTGKYRQVITLLDIGDTLELKGHFEATWVEVEKNWKLRKMYTGHYTNQKISTH